MPILYFEILFHINPYYKYIPFKRIVITGNNKTNKAFSIIKTMIKNGIFIRHVAQQQTLMTTPIENYTPQDDRLHRQPLR